jgi:protein-tyrosine phosphatase
MNNLRDVGGCPAAGGRTVARGRLLRSEALVLPGGRRPHSIWHATHAEAFARLGLRTVIDLRADREVAAAPSAWTEATGAEVVRLPIVEGVEGTDTNYMIRLMSGDLRRFDESDLARLYIATFDRRAAVFGAAVRLLGDAERLPLLVHCSAGKDRTGLLVALVLSVLGTPRELVVCDYTLTGRNRPNRIADYADALRPTGVDPEQVRTLFETPAAAMEQALEHLDATYGGPAGLLLGPGGLTEDDLDALRRALLQD